MDASREIRKVSVDRIDLKDKTFVFTYGECLEGLLLSLKKIGLVNPPLLREKAEEKFQIISGYKRILALTKLGKREVEALVYKGDEISDPDAFCLNLYENIGNRALNTIEKSIILNKLLKEFRVKEEEIVCGYLPLLGLSPHKERLSLYLPLIELEDEIKEALVKERVSLLVAVKLLELSAEERGEVFGLMMKLRLGLNKQREVLTHLWEISRRDNISILELVRDDPISKIQADTRLSISQKAEKIRWILKKRRFPRLSLAQRSFKEKKDLLKLPANISLKPPPFFEGNKFKIEFSFGTKEELKKAAEKLKEISTSCEISEMLMD
ncbi:ParB/RepB/Spo0J family partition protein [bacterium]|nr:ParB/RepB/Spo0J family partition protein [bacterium]MBU1614419.1 ParB/RepB/Spo0J family partition protein [bacterium]